MSIARFAVKRPITTSMIFIALAGLGIVSLTSIGQELYPDIALPTVMILTVSPGVGPYDMEENVSKPIETAVASVNGVNGLESISIESASRVTVRFNANTDMDRALTDLREAITSVETDFPDDTQKSKLFLFTAGMLPSIRLNLYAQTKGIDLRRLVEDKVIKEIERIPGVARATVFGGSNEAVLVEFRLEDMNNLGISVPMILNAFRGENASLPGGVLRSDDRNITLRTRGDFESVSDIGTVTIGSKGDTPIYLRDVADISLSKVVQEEFVYSGEFEALRLSVQKQPGYNTITVNDAVLQRLEELRPELPPSLQIEIIENQAVQVRGAIGGVAESAWQGGLLAIFVLLFFLRNIRSTLIVSITIPLAVVSTFSLINFAGLTLNISSLMGITLAIGMFVDNAIVVLESIYRKMLVGYDRKEAAILGTEEVTGAVTASTLTTLAVFVPMLFVGGLAGVLFKDLSLAISFSLAISLIAAITLIPMMCSRLLHVEALAKYLGVNAQLNSASRDIDDISIADVDVKTRIPLLNKLGAVIKRILLGMDAGYEKIIKWALRHVKTVIITSVALLGISIGLVFLMGMEFLPETDDGMFTVEYETKMGATYQQTTDIGRQIEAIIKDVAGPAIKTISSRIGDGGSNYGEVNVTLVNKDVRSRTIWSLTSEIDTRISNEILDVKQNIAIEGMAALATMSTGISSPVVIKLSGDDIDTMYQYATQIKKTVEGVEGTRNVRISHQLGKPEKVLTVRREEAVSLGLSPLEIATTIRAAYAGITLSTYTQGENDYDIRLILQEADRTDIDQLSQITFINSRGKKIALESVVKIEDLNGPVSIVRKERARVIDIMAGLTGTVPLNQVSTEVEAAVNALGAPPPGVRLSFTGSGSEMASSFGSLFIALIIAIFLVYMVMAIQFEDLVNPFIIMFSIPFAAIGLVLALLITNTTFNILSFTGAILLAGVVVNNAIVLIDYIVTLRKRGMELEKAIAHSGKTRLKPILMSVLTTVIGLIPMAMGWGDGAELRAPMARAVIGGLITSTGITLVLVPVIYYLLEARLRKRLWLPEGLQALEAQKASAAVATVEAAAQLLNSQDAVASAQSGVAGPAGIAATAGPAGLAGNSPSPASPVEADLHLKQIEHAHTQPAVTSKKRRKKIEEPIV